MVMSDAVEIKKTAGRVGQSSEICMQAPGSVEGQFSRVLADSDDIDAFWQLRADGFVGRIELLRIYALACDVINFEAESVGSLYADIAAVYRNLRSRLYGCESLLFGLSNDMGRCGSGCEQKEKE